MGFELYILNCFSAYDNHKIIKLWVLNCILNCFSAYDNNKIMGVELYNELFQCIRQSQKLIVIIIT